MSVKLRESRQENRVARHIQREAAEEGLKYLGQPLVQVL